MPLLGLQRVTTWWWEVWQNEPNFSQQEHSIHSPSFFETLVFVLRTRDVHSGRILEACLERLRFHHQPLSPRSAPTLGNYLGPPDTAGCDAARLPLPQSCAPLPAGGALPPCARNRLFPEPPPGL